MGASDFSIAAVGKTPREAFQAAREQQGWEHGHGGYSGTIYEKGDFVHVALPPRITWAGFLALLRKAEALYFDADVEGARHAVDSARRYGEGAAKKYGGKTLKQWERELAQATAKQAKFWTAVRGRGGEPLERALRTALRYGTVASDKWGPALCLGPLTGKPLTDRLSYAVGAQSERNGDGWQYRLPRGTKLYLFEGLASS